jgi:hypothetical protein
MIEMNNQHAHHSRDPNSCSDIFDVLGRHNRLSESAPPELPVDRASFVARLPDSPRTRHSCNRAVQATTIARAVPRQIAVISSIG